MKKDKIIEYLISEGEIFDHLLDGDLHKLTANQYLLLDDDSNTFKLIQLNLGKKEKVILDSKGKEITQKEEIIEGYRTIKSFDVSNVSNVVIDKYAMSRVYTFDNGEKIRVNGDYAPFENYLSKHHVISNFQERKWYRKIIGFRSGTPWKMILITLLALGLLFLLFDLFTESESEEKIRVAEELKEKKEAETLVKDAEQKKQAEKEKKEKEIADEIKNKKKYEKQYKLEFAPIIEGQIGLVDKNWDNLWIKTFDGVSTGNMDNFTAYENMIDLEKKYENLKDSIQDTKAPEFFTDSDNEMYDKYKEEIDLMLFKRIEAIKKAQDIFNEDNLKPEDVQFLKDSNKESQTYMMNAINNLTSLNMQYNHEYKS